LEAAIFVGVADFFGAFLVKLIVFLVGVVVAVEPGLQYLNTACQS
jgi:hypothetical protein